MKKNKSMISSENITLYDRENVITNMCGTSNTLQTLSHKATEINIIK